MKRLVVILALVPAAAWAQQYLSFKILSTQSQPFNLYLDNRTAPPSGLDPQLTQNAQERAINSWNGVTCAFPKLRGMGGTMGTVANPQDTIDAYSVAPIWLQNQSDPDYYEILGSLPVVAITIPRAYAGVLQTCDVFFNGVNTPWSVAPTPASNANDFESLVLHELGHCLGLDHDNTIGTASVMQPALEVGTTRRALTSYDVQALCGRYPVQGESASPCFTDGGCAQPDLKCLPQPPTNGVTVNMCTRGCQYGANALCDVPLTCVQSTAFSGMTGACMLPGNTVTNVGKPCTAATECGSGLSICRLPDTTPSGNPMWVDGYCTQGCDTSQPACPSGSACLGTPDGRRCLQHCRVGLADCRAEYACEQIDSIGTTGVCIPRCFTDNDCADPVATTCRTCDGLCVPRQNISGQIGDVCQTSSSCGAGQVCRSTSTTNTLTQCTVQCGRGCGTCPAGSTCTPGARGELFCLRDCTGPGTCPVGLRCANTSVGKACQPACSSDPECPVGESCFMGECYPPEFDAGCGTLCNRPDAGKPVVITPKDAGTGPGGTGGCGCTSVDPLLLFAALGLLVRGRRRA